MKNNRGIIPIGAVLIGALAVWLAGYLSAKKAARDEQYVQMLDDTTHVMKIARK